MSRATIRPYTKDDASGVARLLIPFGYSAVTPAIVHQRVTALTPLEDQAVMVAELDGNIAGWIHVCRMPTIVVDSYAEVCALIVDPALHRKGIGRLLIHAAEVWAFTVLGVSRIRLSSNVKRAEAHQFYASLGYANSKSSYVFDKAQEAAEPAKGELCTTRN